MRKIMTLLTTLILTITLVLVGGGIEQKSAHAEQKQLTGSVVFQIDTKEYFVNNQTTGVKMDAAPVIQNNRTYVPVRFLANAFGVGCNNIGWESPVVTLSEPGFPVVELTIGQKQIVVGGKIVDIDAAPVIQDGRIMLPARFVAEVLGYQVDWRQDYRAVVAWPKDAAKPDINKVLDHLLVVEDEETPAEITETERQEEPDPHIVQRGNLVASYKYSGGVLTGAEVFTGVANRGGAGSVEVVFMGRVRGTVVWTGRRIIYLESGESKSVSCFVPATVIRPPGLTTRRRIEITATARPIQLDIDSLIRDLDHEDPKVRRNAAIMLGVVREKRVVEPLIKALEDEDSSVRGNAAKSLGEIGDVRAVEPLIQALNDESRFVRKEASEALREIEDPRVVEPLTLNLFVYVYGSGSVSASAGLLVKVEKGDVTTYHDKYTYGTEVTLTAIPAPGYVFHSWKHTRGFVMITRELTAADWVTVKLPSFTVPMTKNQAIWVTFSKQ